MGISSSEGEFDLSGFVELKKQSNFVILENTKTLLQVQRYSQANFQGSSLEQSQRLLRFRLSKPPHVVAVHGWKLEKEDFGCGNNEIVKIYSERIPRRLSDIKDLNEYEGLLILKDSLLGFKQILREQQVLVKLIPEMIGFNEREEVKVWNNSNYGDLRPYLPMKLKSKSTEHEICKGLMDVVENHVKNRRFSDFFYRYYQKQVDLDNLDIDSVVKTIKNWHQQRCMDYITKPEQPRSHSPLPLARQYSSNVQPESAIRRQSKSPSYSLAKTPDSSFIGKTITRSPSTIQQKKYTFDYLLPTQQEQLLNYQKVQPPHYEFKSQTIDTYKQQPLYSNYEVKTVFQPTSPPNYSSYQTNKSTNPPSFQTQSTAHNYQSYQVKSQLPPAPIYQTYETKGQVPTQPSFQTYQFKSQPTTVLPNYTAYQSRSQTVTLPNYAPYQFKSQSHSPPNYAFEPPQTLPTFAVQSKPLPQAEQKPQYIQNYPSFQIKKPIDFAQRQFQQDSFNSYRFEEKTYSEKPNATTFKNQTKSPVIFSQSQSGTNTQPPSYYIPQSTGQGKTTPLQLPGTSKGYSEQTFTGLGARQAEPVQLAQKYFAPIDADLDEFQNDQFAGQSLSSYSALNQVAPSSIPAEPRFQTMERKFQSNLTLGGYRAGDMQPHGEAGISGLRSKPVESFMKMQSGAQNHVLRGGQIPNAAEGGLSTEVIGGTVYSVQHRFNVPEQFRSHFQQYMQNLAKK